MKLYHFNPNDYGEEYFVMSDNKQMALNTLVLSLKVKVDEYPNLSMYKNVYDFWNGHLIKGSSIKPYTIEEYGKNVVVYSEIA